MKFGSGKRRPLVRNAAALLLPVLMLPGWATGALADAYRVMSGDTLKIDVFLSPEHSAESKVDDQGQITLPAVGRVQASGLTVEEIETAVSDRLTKLSDISSIRVVASVSQYRPLFVVGLVNNPGSYPYAARTTVLQALAVAGGIGNPLMRRAAQVNNPADMVDRQERFDVATLQYWSALARRARLLAEQADAETLEFPADLVSRFTAAGQQESLAREKEIFDARLKTMRNSIAVIEQQKKIVNQEIDSANAYAAEVNESVPAMKKELENLTSLRDKGLTRRLEVLTVARQVSDMQRETRASELAIARSKRELNDLDKQAANLVGLRHAEVAQGLVDTETEISVLKTRLDGQSKLLPAGSTVAIAAAVPGADEQSVSFEIVRLSTDGVASSIKADENTLLVPGDVLNVVPATAPATAAAVSN